MTGKEAIRAAAKMSLFEARKTIDATDDATLRLVCGWRIQEPLAFEELCVYASAPVKMPRDDSMTEQFVAFFSDWQTLVEAADRFGVSRKMASEHLHRAAHRRGGVVERSRDQKGHLVWRVVAGPAQVPMTRVESADAV